MKSPQIQNGYTAIANELLEALVLYKFSQNEYKVIMAVIRKTYGFHKKTDVIGNSQLALMTGLQRTHVARCIRTLIEKQVLVRDSSSYINGLGLNKDYGQWGVKTANSDWVSTSDETVTSLVTGDDENATDLLVVDDKSVTGLVTVDDENVTDLVTVNDESMTDLVTVEEMKCDQFGLGGVTKLVTVRGQNCDQFGHTQKKVKESEKKTPPQGVLITNGKAQEKMCGGGDLGFFCEAEKKPSGEVTLFFPGSLCALERETAVTLLQSCGLDAQAMLDVLAATIKAGKVQTSALGLLGGLVRRYVAGTFDPAPGLKIKIEREKVNSTPRPEKPKLPVDKAKNLQNLAAFRRNTNLR
ncbi:MAG: replication protein [Methylococcaceae bacterium]